MAIVILLTRVFVSSTHRLIWIAEISLISGLQFYLLTHMILIEMEMGLAARAKLISSTENSVNAHRTIQESVQMSIQYERKPIEVQGIASYNTLTATIQLCGMSRQNFNIV